MFFGSGRRPFDYPACDVGLMELGLPLYAKLDWGGLMDLPFFFDESESFITLASRSEEKSSSENCSEIILSSIVLYLLLTVSDCACDSFVGLILLFSAENFSLLRLD